MAGSGVAAGDDAAATGAAGAGSVVSESETATSVTPGSGARETGVMSEAHAAVTKMMNTKREDTEMLYQFGLAVSSDTSGVPRRLDDTSQNARGYRE